MATTEAILRAIQIINSNAQISISGNDLDSITWENGTSPISKSDIEAKIFLSLAAKLKILGLTDDEIEAFRG